MPDDALPTGLALAERLFDLRLAPYGCAENHSAGGIITPREFLIRRDKWQRWIPWQDISDCWYLVEQFGLSIVCASEPFIQKRPGVPVLRRGWVEGWGIPPTRFASFAEIPTAICQAALLLETGRARA